MNKEIKDIKVEEIFDSRNTPTLRVSVSTENNIGSFEVPSGASTGKYEAWELRDNTEDNPKGVSKAASQIENILKPKLVGVDVDQQEDIDNLMIKEDGTSQKTKIGGNSMIGVSIASLKTAAKEEGKEIYEYLKSRYDIPSSKQEPFLYFNLINGGKHAKSQLAFQEYHIVPQTNIEESLEISKNVQEKLDEIILREYNQEFTKGDEGGVALPTEDILKPLRLLREAVESLGYSDKVMFALDVAASSFYDHDKNVYKFMGKEWGTEDMIKLYEEIARDYPTISIEDPLDEEDFEGFAKLQSLIPEVRIVGDDLTVTNKERLEKAIKHRSIKAIIIKPNQIGTLTETIETIKLARENNIDCIVSHRSGETMDSFISDLAYAFGCFGIKAGALGPKERNVKYDRSISIINNKK